MENGQHNTSGTSDTGVSFDALLGEVPVQGDHLRAAHLRQQEEAQQRLEDARLHAEAEQRLEDARRESARRESARQAGVSALRAEERILRIQALAAQVLELRAALPTRVSALAAGPGYYEPEELYDEDLAAPLIEVDVPRSTKGVLDQAQQLCTDLVGALDTVMCSWQRHLVEAAAAAPIPVDITPTAGPGLPTADQVAEAGGHR